MSASTRCRLCWTEYDDSKLENMLTVSNDSINLWTMYNYIMNVGEHVDSAAVPYSCIKCEGSLKIAYSFKLMCSETEKTLNELANSEQNDNESEMKLKIEQSGNESEIEYLYFDELIEYNVEEDEDNVDAYEDNSIPDHVETVFAEVNDDDTIDDDLFSENIDEIATNQVKLNIETMKADVTQHKCRTCNIQFKDVKDHKAHYKEHHLKMYRRKINNYDNGRQCRACNLKFVTLKEYSLHYRQFHARKRPSRAGPLGKAVCPHCGILISKTSMSKHINSKHLTTGKKTYECKICGKSFSYRENLLQHMRIHNNEKRWECKICGEKFVHWASRRSHVISKHTFEKNYECHLCGERFHHSGCMYRHIRRHTNEKSHCCTFCPKTFATQPQLRDHQVVHTKVKNEICEICQKPFGTQKNLRAHMRIHSGERNYVCWVCDKRFTQAHVLRTHLKTHPDVEMPERGAILSQKALRAMSLIEKVPTVVVDKE